MTHQEVVGGGIVDLYVARALPPGTAAAFEEHTFECDECFDAVRTADALRAGVRHLAAAGELPPEVAAPIAAPARAGVPRWIPYAAAAAVAGMAIWLPYSRAQRLEGQLSDTQQRAAALESQLAQARARPAPAAAVEPAAEANIPVAVLQTTRTEDRPVRLTIPPGATRFVIWIDTPASPAASVEVVLVSEDGSLVARAASVRPNADGALVVSFATRLVREGTYTVQQVAGGRVAARHAVRILRRN